MKQTDAFLSVLIGFVVAYRRPNVSARALGSHLQQIFVDSGPVWQRVGVGRAQVETLIKAVAGGRASKDGAPTPNYARLLTELYLTMRPDLKALYDSRSLTNEQVKLAKTAAGLLRYNPDNAVKRDAQLDAELHILPDRAIRVMFTPPNIQPPHDALAEVKLLVRKFVGRNDVGLSVDESKAVKERDPVRYARYLKLLREVKTSYKPIVRKLVRDAGHPVLVAEVVRELVASGFNHFPYRPFAKSRLCVDEDGLLTTQAPYYKKIDALPTTGSEVKLNPAYNAAKDDTFPFWYKVPNTKNPDQWKTAKTISVSDKRRTDKDHKVLDAIPMIPVVRPRWLTDLMSSNIQRATLGAMVETMYQVAPRPGSVGNGADGKDTYGFTTLQVGHVRRVKQGYSLTYLGKDAKKQQHFINTTSTPEGARIGKVIAHLMKNKKPGDYLWSSKEDRVTADEINTYLKAKGWPLTGHKFRNVRGTELMLKRLSEVRLPKNASPTDVAKHVKSLAIDVGAMLGHVSGEKTTPNTALKSYIAPSVLHNFFKSRGIKSPKWVPKIGGKGGQGNDA